MNKRLFSLVFLCAFALFSTGAVAEERAVPGVDEIQQILEQWNSFELLESFEAIEMAYPVEDLDAEGTDVRIRRNFQVPFLYGTRETRASRIRINGNLVLAHAIIPFDMKEPAFGYLLGRSTAFIRCKDNSILLGDRLEIRLHIDEYHRKNRVRSVWVTLYKNDKLVKDQIVSRTGFVCSPMP